MKPVCLATVISAFVLLSSCATVKPWERANLAKPVMEPSHNMLGKAMASHMFFSREASSGGDGLGGGGCGGCGGCGCN